MSDILAFMIVFWLLLIAIGLFCIRDQLEKLRISYEAYTDETNRLLAEATKKEKINE